MSCNRLLMCFSKKSCTFDKIMSVMWWWLGISYLGSSTLTRCWNPVLATTDNGWSLRAIYWVCTAVIFATPGLSLDIFFDFSSVCCKVGCCCLLLLSLTNSWNSVSCCFFKCFIKLLVLKELVFAPPLDNLVGHFLQSAVLLSSLFILKNLQTADN